MDGLPTLLIILLISIPIFYVWGLASCVRTIFQLRAKNKKDTEYKQSDAELFKAILPKLTLIATKYPKKTVADVVKEYTEYIPPTSDEETETVETKIFQETNVVNIHWQNWINDNSINLLLYLGAFLIVAAASIFVGFQWQTFSGYTKAGMLSGLTALFFILGLWFYQKPKIKNAGATFLGIGSLLLPICGAGWYTFVLKDLGMPLGTVWLITSFIALITYISLAIFLHNEFYSYIASLSALSFSFSFVNAYQLTNDFYILAAMLSSIVLLATSLTYKRISDKNQKLFTRPLSLTAHVTLPASLLYGFVIALNSNSLATLESTVSIFLASGFYVMSYIYFKKIPFLVVGQILLSVAILILGNWLHFENYTLVYILMLFALYEVFLGYIFETRSLPKESETITLMAIAKLTLFFLFGIFLEVTSFHLFVFSLTCILGGIFAFVVRKNTAYIGYSFVAAAVAAYILYVNVFHFDDQLHGLGIIYALFGTVSYALLLYFKKRREYFTIFNLATIFFYILAVIFTITSAGYCLLVSVIIYGLLLSGWYSFSEKKLLYISNVMLSFSLWNLLQALSISYDYYPLAYSALYTTYYLVSVNLPDTYQQIYRLSSMIGLIATPILFGSYSYEYGLFTTVNRILEKNALITAYVATAIYALDYVKYKTKNMAYVASAMGMITFLWQINILNISETQAYTLPLSFYFFGLAYLQKKTTKSQKRDILNFTGIFFLLTPSFLQSFGEKAMQYSVLFGFEGIVLLMAGITMKRRSFIYSGSFALIFAVISQTYQYVFTIPRWVLVGSIGLLFLTLAIFLLNKRKE
ncbi:MAG TPA: DUF2157 domain-containing protein [Candidatus Saccharimonadales bacterium]|nr:DUF2157 domain-containing protein [Candidatus Saccharimonadales bacterium]